MGPMVLKMALGGMAGRGGWGGPGEGEGWSERGSRGGRRGPGGGRGGRMFAGGELRLVLLKLIGDHGRHGYELIKAIEELTGGEYAPSPGVIYPTLSLLVDEGLIAEAEGSGARKAFAITDEGRAELDAKADEADALLERLTALGERRERGESPPVRRAIGNLFAALRQRVWTSGVDKETAHAVADILDEAARRIERL